VSKIAFDFVLDYLNVGDINVKPMFGCHAIYSGDKLLLITRNKADHSEDNGVWVCVIKNIEDNLNKDLPGLRDLKMFGPSQTGWKLIPVESDDFEQSVLKVCDLINKGNEFIGRVPKRKKKKKD